MLGMLSGVLIRYFSPFNLPLLIIPLPLLLGGVFPLLLRLASSQSQDLPGRTGRIYLSNSAGAFAGAMISQFYGFQYLGSKGLIVAFFLIGIITGITCLAWKAAQTKTHTSLIAKYLIPGLGLMLACVPLLIPAAVWDVYTFNHTGPNVDRVEGVSGVAVIDWEANHTVGHIEVNGQFMSALPHHPKHIRLESIALAMPRRERVVMLGLGSAMVRALVNDPEIKQLDLVDWSYELPLILQTPQANAVLHNALNHPKARLFHADARVAVSLYQDQTFDLAIDNLGYLGWAGSTSIKSITYFKEIRRILKPAGVFVLDPNCVGVKACNAILAGLIENFRYVQTHQSSVVIASDQRIEINPDRATEIMRSRGQLLGLSEPYADWLLNGFQSVTAQDLKGTQPIFDELLIYEYTIFGSVNLAD
jgi:SAM-dependent methyltransferase